MAHCSGSTKASKASRVYTIRGEGEVYFVEVYSMLLMPSASGQCFATMVTE